MSCLMVRIIFFFKTFSVIHVFYNERLLFLKSRKKILNGLILNLPDFSHQVRKDLTNQSHSES